MTEKEEELLAILAEQDAFHSVAVLRHNHDRLQQYTKRQIVWTLGILIKDDLVTKIISGPEREVKYKITDTGRMMAESLV